jgi:hypothetical protein
MSSIKTTQSYDLFVAKEQTLSGKYVILPLQKINRCE